MLLLLVLVLLLLVLLVVVVFVCSQVLFTSSCFSLPKMTWWIFRCCLLVPRCSFVILHGTDTMAYTASALSFMLENLGKTVILTGSQVSIRGYACCVWSVSIWGYDCCACSVLFILLIVTSCNAQPKCHVLLHPS